MSLAVAAFEVVSCVSQANSVAILFLTVLWHLGDRELGETKQLILITLNQGGIVSTEYQGHHVL